MCMYVTTWNWIEYIYVYREYTIMLMYHFLRSRDLQNPWGQVTCWDEPEPVANVTWRFPVKEQLQLAKELGNNMTWHNYDL